MQPQSRGTERRTDKTPMAGLQLFGEAQKHGDADAVITPATSTSARQSHTAGYEITAFLYPLIEKVPGNII